MSQHGPARRRFESAPKIFFEEDFDGEHATLVPHFDVEAFARHACETTSDEDVPWGDDLGPGSGIRPSMPTLPHEVGPLVNEPEADTLLRLVGGGDRELRVRVPVARIVQHHLEPAHGYVLGLLDGGTSITDVLDISTLGRIDTLRAIEALVQLGIVA